ncbi:Fanconi anemia core complex-associated protein 20 isoform X1 [Heterocephalus glaber]|uniref:Fanconi anemia core complex-associated protein 20 isoform X1 n=2 Tax=Heterocephalus glaber TaxID=10181 RepID=A0AAX6QKY9_HETGA|nr:Fanconi anemia core complex-associated protein 20 isoform X1 [Heterocephalus glaber]
MEEAAWRPRGKLSRRRAPSGGGPRPPAAEGPSDPLVSPMVPSGSPQCPPSSGESKLWAALLRAVLSDPVLDGLPLSPLPTFPSQEAGPENLESPEVFTVGTKAFTWTPFPPAHGGQGHAERPVRGPAGPLGSPTPSLEGQHVPDPCGTPRPQEQLTKEGALALQSCPMCQKEFTADLPECWDHIGVCASLRLALAFLKKSTSPRGHTDGPVPAPPSRPPSQPAVSA